MDVALAGSTLTYRPNDDQLAGLSIEYAAFDGEVGFGVLPVPDPAAALTVATGRSCRIDEGTTRLTDGFVLDQDRTRGPVPAGTARVYGFGIMDANALLGGFRVVRSSPSQTDVARVLAFAAVDGPAWETTMVINANTVTMPAKKYDSDGGWGELIPDLVEFTGKTLWLHDKADGSGRCLHYHVLTSGHTSGLFISDVVADIDGVTTFGPIAPQRNRTSVDLRNDVMGRDQAGRTHTSTDGTSIAAHDADGLQHQALIDFETTGQADLNVKTAAFLASQKNDLDTFSCSIGPLDEAALAEIRVGDLISVTSSVMGLTASTQRIAHMTLTPNIGVGGRAGAGWFASLEMAYPIRRRARIKNVAPPVILPPFAGAECGSTFVLDDFDRSDGTFANVPTPQNAAGTSTHSELWQVFSGTAAIASNRMELAANTTAYIEAFDANRTPAGISWEFERTGDVLVSTVLFDDGSDDVAVCAVRTDTGVVLVYFNAGFVTTSLPFVFTMGDVYQFRMVLSVDRIRVKVWLGTDPEPSAWMVDHVDTVGGADTGGTPFVQFHNTPTSDPIFIDNLSFGCSATPHSGQWVSEDVGIGNGVISCWSTTYPYRPGSLDAYVDGLIETHITEDDPSIGLFCFDTEPFDTETVRARYQAA